ncbi:MAG TPA: YcxB family protein [Verrucomicrobiae bacterium]
MTLQLEYSCTEAELKEAKVLQERQVYGRGSKWRARLVLFGLLALVLGGAYLRFKREMTPRERVWFVGMVVVIFVVLRIFQRITRRKTNGPVRLEFSEREVVIHGGGGRSAILWSGFSQCLESPNLFVLVDRTKAVLFVVPKRAFPDEAAQNYFRAQANQPRSVAPATTDEALVPGRFVSNNGIALIVKLRYRDYLSRNFTSWRMKGVCLGLLALVTGMIFLTPPPPDAVNSSLKTFLIMVPMLGGMLVLMMFIVPFISWHGEKKHLSAQHIVVTGEGMEFADRDSGGRVPWSTYKYYLENRWGFFVWNPRGSVWFMFPKRAFASASDLEQLREVLGVKLERSRWFYL